VIDVVVTSEGNAYPFWQAARNPAWTVEQMVNAMEKRVCDAINACKPMFNWLTDESVSPNDVMRPTGLANSSRLLTKKGKPLRALTVKVRFSPAHEVCAAGLGNKQVYVEELVTQALQWTVNPQEEELPVFVAKLKYTDAHGNGFRRFTQIDAADSQYKPTDKSPAQAVIDG
jgi:hypothetical protein